MESPDMHRPPARRFSSFVARRPLTTVLILLFPIAYGLQLLWGLAYYGVLPGGSLNTLIGAAPDELAALLGNAAMIVLALYVTWAREGRAGLRTLAQRIFRWRVGLRWWLAALLGLPLLTIAIAVLLGDAPLYGTAVLPLLTGQLAQVLVTLLVINLWEETVWTGLFQTRLEQRHNLLIASWLVAIPFAMVHLPLQFFLGTPVTAGSLAIAFLVYLAFGMIVRPMFAVFRRATGDSLLLVGLLHSVFNRTNNQDGVTAALLDGDARKVAILLAALAFTLVVALTVRRNIPRHDEPSPAETSNETVS
jgi:membrane protease YdiL (CAAX protease family)